jgi:hypothetical protein
MKISKRMEILKLFFFIFLMVFILFSFKGTFPDSSNINKGFYDMRNLKFPLEKAIALDGEWEFYPVFCEEIKVPLEDKEHIYLNVPKIWNNFEVTRET